MSRRTKRRRALQVSLRLVLTIITVICVGLAIEIRFRQQRLAVEELAGIGARITYHPRWRIGVPGWGSFRDVRSVDLSHCQFESDQIELLRQFPRIERLYLARTKTSNDHLKVIASLHGLRRLALWHTQISNRGVRHLETLTELRKLDVHGTTLTEAALESFAKLPHLRALRISIRNFTDKGLHCLGRMPQVHVGDLKLENVTDNGLKSLRLVDPANYRVTHLKDAMISDQAMLDLGRPHAMLPVGPTFQVRNTPLSDRILKRLPWSRLGDVRFINTNISFDGVTASVGESTKALYIGDSGCGLARDWDWEGSRAWRPLGFSVWLDVHPSTLTAAQVAMLPQLTSLHLQSKNHIGDLVLHLADHRHLTHIEMDAVPPGTSLLEQLGKLSHLQFADLNFCNPRTNLSIRPLANLRQLKTLKTYCTPFGDEQMDVIGELRQLEELVMYSADGVKGPGLRHLSKLRELRHVRIQSRADWDESLKYLLRLAHVRRIELINVKLNAANLQQFKSVAGRSYVSW